MQSDKEKNFISAVIYVYNQEKIIFRFLELLDRDLTDIFEKYEIICVNDSSEDKSVSEIRRYADLHHKCTISVINMSFYQGMELSMNAGIDLAIGDFVYEFDSVLSDYPDYLIGDVYFHALKGHDIVSAAPREQSHKDSSLFYFIFNRAARNQYLLRTETFRILSRRAINRVRSMNDVTPYRKAIYANCGLSMDTLFFEGSGIFQEVNKRVKRSQRETATDALVLYTELAYRFSITFSVLMMFMVMGCGMYTLYIYCSGRPVAGWTTTMLFLSFSFLGIFVILTILVKYVSIILKLNFNRQKYIFESVEKLK